MFSEIREKLKLFYGDELFDRRINNHLLFTGVDGFANFKWVSPSALKDGFDSHEFPDALKLDYSGVERIVRENPDKFLIASVWSSFFERAWGMYGMENLLADMVGDVAFVSKFLERILEYNLNLISCYIKYDVDCIHINDDYGQQRGLIMGTPHWRRFFKPGLKLMVEKIKSGGKYAYLHSCGDLTSIIPDLIEIGFDVINPLQPDYMDVFKLKEEYGDHITFHGGVSEQMTLNFGTPDDVEAEMRDKMERLGRNGGYILAPSQGITKNVPVENAARFIEVATSQGM